ncbi:MAG: cytidylate kinase [Candidatus Aenigmatarchaeota archaeon]|nr:MAG: cytidylate kinase [Candidatus Aenigmarchaeota archaeon]
MIIVFSGMAAVGKTTLARAVAKRYGLEFHCGGEVLLEIAREEGYNPSGEEWWDTKEGVEFLKRRKEDLEFDKILDRKMLELASTRKGVFTSWTLPWIYSGPAINFWLKVPKNERARRMALRDKITEKEALKIIEERDEHNKELYKKLYGIELEKDLEPFDFVLNIGHYNIPESKQVVFSILDILRDKGVI